MMEDICSRHPSNSEYRDIKNKAINYFDDFWMKHQPSRERSIKRNSSGFRIKQSATELSTARGRESHSTENSVGNKEIGKIRRDIKAYLTSNFR